MKQELIHYKKYAEDITLCGKSLDEVTVNESRVDLTCKICLKKLKAKYKKKKIKAGKIQKKILKYLKEQKLAIQEEKIARKLDLTVSQVHRACMRLHKRKLIGKERIKRGGLTFGGEGKRFKFYWGIM